MSSLSPNAPTKGLNTARICSFARFLLSSLAFIYQRFWEKRIREKKDTEELIRKMVVCMVARQGRELQRYTSSGGRLVVGCIPYKFKEEKPTDSGIDQAVEVLVITSQKGHGMMFPKGGWELDETIDQAVYREAMEEAGVLGVLEGKLGNWSYRSKRYDTMYEGIMYALSVTVELLQWPEMNVRKRKWVSVAEAREGCQHGWMLEALDQLIKQLSTNCMQETAAA